MRVDGWSFEVDSERLRDAVGLSAWTSLRAIVSS